MPKKIFDEFTDRVDLTPKQKYEARHKERYKRLAQEGFKRLKADLPKYLYKSAKARAKKKGSTFNISISDIVVPEVCPILGIPLFSVVGGKASINSPSLDRRDSSRGYTKDNIKVISHKANSNKGDMTIDEVERMLSYMKGDI